MKVLDAVLACFIALLKVDSRDVLSLSSKPDFVPACIKLLDACQDGDQLGSLDILSNFDLSQMGIKRPEKLMVINDRVHDKMSKFNNLIHSSSVYGQLYLKAISFYRMVVRYASSSILVMHNPLSLISE